MSQVKLIISPLTNKTHSHFLMRNVIKLWWKNTMLIKPFYVFVAEGTWNNGSCFNPEEGIPFKLSKAYLEYNITDIKETQTPVEAYWK
jgi:hypothetical protein